MPSIKIERVSSWPSVVLFLELLLAAVVGFIELRKHMHGAIALTIAIVGLIAALALVIGVPIVFWVWTAFIAGSLGYQVFGAIDDRGWAIFWGAATVLIVVGIHLRARQLAMRDTDYEIVE